MRDEDPGAACELMDASNHRGYPGRTPERKCERHLLHLDNTPPTWKPKPGAMGEFGLSDARVKSVSYRGKDEATVWAYGPGGIGYAKDGLRYWVKVVREDGRWLVHEMEYPV